MNPTFEYHINTANFGEVVHHLERCNIHFVPQLSTLVDIKKYAKKIETNAMRFEAWWSGQLVGLVAAYCNDQVSRVAYVTNVSVLPEWQRHGIAAQLMQQCIKYATGISMEQIELEVSTRNTGAIVLYEKIGFMRCNSNASKIDMHLDLKVE